MKNENRLRRLKGFIRENVKAAGKKGVVIGVSGGVDSAACLYLAVSALGKENCLAFHMPHDGRTMNPEVKLITNKLKVSLSTYDISRIISIFSGMTGETDPLMIGNFAARIRSAFLYREAASRNMLVMNTSNRSEIMTGYFTKWGDEAGDISPFGNYYKSEVYEMASSLGVPEKILQKPPSPDFFQGQRDEEELGISYRELDCALACDGKGEEEKADAELLLKVRELKEKSSHKRNSPIRALRFD